MGDIPGREDLTVGHGFLFSWRTLIIPPHSLWKRPHHTNTIKVFYDLAKLQRQSPRVERFHRPERKSGVNKMTLDNKTALVKETEDRLDRVDILVNNAVRLCALE